VIEQDDEKLLFQVHVLGTYDIDSGSIWQEYHQRFDIIAISSLRIEIVSFLQLFQLCHVSLDPN
jgi:hypothetical protein